MEQEPTLDQVFANAPESDVEAIEPETPAPEQEPEETASAGATDGDTGESGESTPDSSKDEEKDPAWQLAAYLDEKSKRQERDKRIEELEQKLSALDKPKEEKRPSVFEDEDGFTQTLTSQAQQYADRVRFDLSRDFMAAQHEDYEQRESEFAELAKNDPSLVAQLRQHPNPARFAYEQAVKAERMRELENPDAYEAKVREKLEAEIREKIAAELEAEKAKKSKPPSLANARSTAGSSHKGEPSLQDILGR